MSSLRERWLAEPTELTFEAWRRLQTVPAGLLNPQPVVVQRAEKKVVATKVVAPKPVKVRRERTHGTGWGWRQHKKLGEVPCDDCWAAKRAEDKAWRDTQPKNPRELKPCGTPAAARRHRAHGEKVCDDCRAAESAASRNDTKRKSQREWVARKRSGEK